MNKLDFSRRYDCVLANLKALEWIPMLNWHQISENLDEVENDSSYER